ncbi:MAG: prepilin-type N-terminal cleavage/methylation domain-containing protein [Desulfobacterales bacterium]|nr:prepilin-type N-terminal cleavage/methylation domain-containing protein [Desulfobacterales bacterium]
MAGTNLLESKSGFTLIELTVVIAIMSIVLGAIFSVFAATNRSATNNEVIAEVMQNLRISIDFMEQDIRMAGLDRFDSANAGIEAATATNLRFTADRNMDGALNDSIERITYLYDAANNRLRQCLWEGTLNDWQTLAENVTNFQFSYLDADDNLLAFPIADLNQIRTVVVSISVEQPSGRSGPVERTINKRILCRNLLF